MTEASGEADAPLPITGSTRCLPLVGTPVDQVHTPPILNRYFASNGINAVVFPLDVPSDGINAFFDNLRHWRNCVGCSVTVPHKQAAFAAVDDLTRRAGRLGAVNIVRREAGGRLVGDMTDGEAFVRAMSARRSPARVDSALVIGAGGGAGMAVAYALCGYGITRLVAIERCADRFARLKSTINEDFPDIELLAEYQGPAALDLLVNATPLGMQADDPLPFGLEHTRSVALVADVITRPALTPLLLAARRRDLEIQTGREMGDHQLEAQMRHLALWVPDDDAAQPVGEKRQ